MKKTTNLKALVLSVAILVGMFMPTSVFAQNDDFFRDSDNFGGNRDSFAVTWAITNSNIGDAPLSGGLLIMLSAGAGYLLLKKRED